MIIKRLKDNISRNLVNFPGWKTDRKIVVIESDDWGSIRMPSKQVFDKLLKSGISVDKDPYCLYDSLENDDDLTELFEILLQHKDKNENYPVLTTNTVVANPDFKRIGESNFEEYFFEPFTVTLNKYPNRESTFDLIKQGISNKLIFPQFHGREHVNVRYWLNELKHNNTFFKKTFMLGLWGLSSNITGKTRINIQASFDALDIKEIEIQKLILKEGLELFTSIFGFQAKSFIANNFIWDSELNQTLAGYGINILQGMKYQLSPIYNNEKRKHTRHKTGEFNSLNQVYLVRNCHFEPSVFPKIDSVNSCLKDINNAFLWYKPAIISSHRINFIGSIKESNRTINLKSLNRLLHTIINNWPDVEFMTSLQLGNLIESQKR